MGEGSSGGTGARVTVVIPSYNHERFVVLAIRSVLDQTFNDYQIIITDDGSTDNSVREIQKVVDSRISFFPLSENIGACAALNLAIGRAKSDYIAILNSDDLFVPEKLARQVDYLDQHPEIGAVFSAAQFIDEDGQPFNAAHLYENKFKVANRSRFSWLNHFFFKENCLCHPTILIRSECYRTLGGYNESYAQLPDFEFWIRLCLRYEIYVSPEKFIQFRILNNDGNASAPRPEVLSRADWEHRRLLYWFLEIPPADFCKVFPEYTGTTPQTRRDVSQALAQVALKADVHHGFAIDVLYGLMREEGSTDSFGHRDFIALTGKYGNVYMARLAALEKECKLLSVTVQQQQRQLESQNDHLIRKDQQIDAIMQSTSWRITNPFRRLVKRLRNGSLARKMAPSSVVTPHNPLISIFVVLDGAPKKCCLTVQSLVRQTYSHWQCIVSGKSRDMQQTQTIQELTGKDGRVKQIDEFSGYQLPDEVEGEFLIRLNPGEVLAGNAIELLVRELGNSPDAKLIYCDETLFDNDGNFVDYYKPAWNQDLFYSIPYIERGVLISTALIREVEGFDPDYGEAQDYDVLMKCFERLKPSQIRHLAVTLYSREGLPQVLPKGKGYTQAVMASLTRQGINAEVLPSEAEGVLHICYPVPAPPPLVSIIILTRDRLDLLQRCVESILGKTDYPSYEIIIVDNGSQEPSTLDYLRALEQQGNARIIRDDRPFNFSALNNIAIRQACGRYIATLNNDIEVIGNQWLKEMVSHACRPGVGAVGARLWFPDDTLQHGGVIFVKGSALHAHRGIARGNSGYWGRAVAVQNFSAVTAACLVIRKDIYLKVGGMNETDLSISYNDIDLCLKLSVAGYRTVWTPHAELYHYESASRGDDMSPENRKRALAEYAYLVRRWGGVMENDPAWNPEIKVFSAGGIAAQGQKK